MKIILEEFTKKFKLFVFRGLERQQSWDLVFLQ